MKNKNIQFFLRFCRRLEGAQAKAEGFCGGRRPPTEAPLRSLSPVPTLTSYSDKEKRLPVGSLTVISKNYQIARVTLPERKQRVQAWTLLGEPFTIALTRFTLGFHVLFERLCEWDTLMPKDTSLPQKSHFAMCRTSLKILNYIMLKYNSRKQNKMQ